MARNFTQGYREATSSISKPEAPLLLLEIAHPDLSSPVRIVNDNLDVVSGGNVYTALAFRATLPDDLSTGQPRANLAIDNVGRDLADWIEQSGGGEGATVKMMQILRSAPDVVEWSVLMDLTEVQMTPTEITGTLTFVNLLDRPGVPMLYRPENTPGLF